MVNILLFRSHQRQVVQVAKSEGAVFVDIPHSVPVVRHAAGGQRGVGVRVDAGMDVGVDVGLDVDVSLLPGCLELPRVPDHPMLDGQVAVGVTQVLEEVRQTSGGG